MKLHADRSIIRGHNKFVAVPLPTSDIKTLVDQLDHNCLVYLEKASLFCVRQKYAEVSVAHMVMSKSVDYRFQTGQEMLAALEKL